MMVYFCGGQREDMGAHGAYRVVANAVVWCARFLLLVCGVMCEICSCVHRLLISSSTCLCVDSEFAAVLSRHVVAQKC